MVGSIKVDVAVRNEAVLNEGAASAPAIARASVDVPSDASAGVETNVACESTGSELQPSESPICD